MRSNERALACSADCRPRARTGRPRPGSPAEQDLVAKFVRAYQSGDVDALVALLTSDVTVSMPPIPLE